jgi:hypothetical protein
VSPSRSIERHHHYLLVDGKPVPEPDLLKWAEAFETMERTLRQDFFVYRGGRELIAITKEQYGATLQHRPLPNRKATQSLLKSNARARRKRKQAGGIPIMVSTVFLGIDHGYEGPPILWETMVFGTDFQDFGQARYRSQEEAIAGHAAIVAGLLEYVKREVPALPERTEPIRFKKLKSPVNTRKPKGKPS